MLDIIARVKLLFDKDKDFRAELAGILGFLPHKIELYKIAFSHSSIDYHSRQGGKRLNNERLEFLGDAILEAVVSDLVFHHFENKREGFLTNTRSKIVQRTTLNELATKMGVDRLIRSSTRGQSHNNNIGGNAFEALIGAIYLDRGYSACKRFVQKQILRDFVNIDDVAQKEGNFKSKILEYCQKNRINCEFKLKNIDKGDTNSPQFRSILDIEGVMVGEGKGYSKKESEQAACRDALLRMRRSQDLVNQIFESKEKRTCTEAPIFVAVPKIDEIEEEIARMGEAKTERRRQQRQRQRERREQERQPASNKPQEQPKAAPQPKKEQNTPKAQPEARPKDRENKKAKPTVSEPVTATVDKAEAKPEKTDRPRNEQRRKPKNAATQPAEQKAGAENEAPKEANTPAKAEQKAEPKPEGKATPKADVPAPLFMLNEVKTKPTPTDNAPATDDAEAKAAEKKARRGRRKAKAADAEAVKSPEKTKAEAPAAATASASTEEKAPEVGATENTSDAPEAAPAAKKPRRTTRRRKPAAKAAEGGSEAQAGPSATATGAAAEAPTLPFEPQA
ncbi:MAG: ribonuclease III [Bacteroidaceae bacterium]|nr:ribonuclease III [Bacteroidaceae bacterium]